MAMSIQEAVERVYGGARGIARKRGRNPKFPFVPIIQHAVGGKYGDGREEQIRGKAFESKEAAVAYAEKHLKALRDWMADRLADPVQGRAMRKQFDIQLEEQ